MLSVLPVRGVLSEDLGEACLKAALEMEPFEPAAVLKQFTWDACADIFESALAFQSTGQGSELSTRRSTPDGSFRRIDQGTS